MQDVKLYVQEDHHDIIEDEDGIRVIAVYGDDREQRTERAKRIVACCNFFQGIETEDIPKR